jgi:hypothetical protein
MSRSHRIYFPMAALLLAAVACAMPGVTSPDISAISTTAAQTVIAGITQNIPTVTLLATLESTPTITVTFTRESPTLTPTETLTPTLIVTPTPLIPLISVSVNTNCRNGPGKVYNMQGALLVGEVAQVYGRDPTNNYWYIRNPDPGPEFCWVWGQYATLTGPFLLLPVFTPPPTPTATLTPTPSFTPTPSPAFNAEYASLDTCNSSWWVEIKLKNTGSISFRSADVSVKDKVTSIVQVALTDGFTDIDGCLKTTTKDKLGIGDTYLLSAPAFNYNPTGHELLITLTLCSDTGQKGMCTTRKVKVTP